MNDNPLFGSLLSSFQRNKLIERTFIVTQKEAKITIGMGIEQFGRT
jgi:hypothetical protein